MDGHFDVIVAGVGAMGAAACWHLARRGVRVLGLEQFELPHARGSSHGFSRMTRSAYYEHPDYVPLVRRANTLWSELEAETGERLLHLVGGLYLGEPEGTLVRGSLESARRHGLAHERLGHAELRRRFPPFQLPEHWIGVHEPGAGYLLPELAISSLVVSALRHGAEIRAHEHILSWEREGDAFAVTTSRGRYRAGRLVVCCGAWSGRLLADLGIQLVVTRQVLGWVWPRDWQAFSADRFPVWMLELPGGPGCYGFPLSTLGPGLKVGEHVPQRPTDPDQVAREPLPGDEETFRGCLRQYLPSADGPLLALRTCLYTNSPDGHFIVDRHPATPGVVLAAGFSGHGFKFAPVIGEALADLSTHGRTELPVGFLALGRFASR